MAVTTKSNTGSRNTHRRNLIIASLFVVALVVSLCAYLFVTNTVNVVHVKSETELVKAIDGVKVSGSSVIVLDKDIDLTATIIISARKNITLTSNGDNQFKLVGADRASTLAIETGSTLILDGIVVIHAEGTNGCGVGNAGTFIMYSGVISGNTVRDNSGGGVSTSGVFEMYGGEIVNNVARVSGGGVNINGNGAVFSMFGGVISGNTVYGGGGWGGGVYRYEWAGTFNWYGGEIYGNAADNNENIYPITVHKFKLQPTVANITS